MSKVIKQRLSLGMFWPTFDPFLFCAFHNDSYPAGNEKLGPQASLAGRSIGQDFAGIGGWRMYHGDVVPGFPSHPHRGFETVTIVNKGYVDHADSMGAAGRYGVGDTQWMTAGSGVQHSEMFPLLRQNEPNPLELFQIWLNLPARNKMVEPHFAMLWNEQTPNVAFTDDEGNHISVKVVAGSLSDQQGNQVAPLAPPPNSWASQSDSEVAIWLIDLPANATWTIPEAVVGLNRTLYFFEGDAITIAGEQANVSEAYVVDSSLPLELVGGDKPARLLMLQGRPIGEPVAQHGPFVMNTRQELQQAFFDFQRTQFGGWPWPDNDQTHGVEIRRFAKHADGTVETP